MTLLLTAIDSAGQQEWVKARRVCFPLTNTGKFLAEPLWLQAPVLEANPGNPAGHGQKPVRAMERRTTDRKRTACPASLCTALSGLVLTACVESGPGPALIPPAATLRVGLSGDYPPFCQSASGPGSWLDHQGFDVDLLKRLSDDLGLPAVNAVRFQWPGLSDAMRTNALDVAVCGITVRRDRALTMAFTRPYAISGAVAVLRTADSHRFRELTALNRPDVRLGVNSGGHLERVTRSRFPQAAIRTTRHNNALQSLLDAREVDAVISDNYEAGLWRGVVTLGPFTHDRKAIALPLDRLSLRDQIDNWLAAREADGWLTEQRRALGAQAEFPAEEVCAEALSASIELRFSLMPLVAAVKRRDRLPITAAAQEAVVLEQAREIATQEGLSKTAATRLFEVLIDMSKRIQQQEPAVDAGNLTLPALRGALTAASRSLLPEIRRCRNVLTAGSKSLDAAIHRGLADWLDEGQIQELLDVLPPRMRFTEPAIQPSRSQDGLR
jgi:cyclohexadienyl dehydratase